MIKGEFGFAKGKEIIILQILGAFRVLIASMDLQREIIIFQSSKLFESFASSESFECFESFSTTTMTKGEF